MKQMFPYKVIFSYFLAEIATMRHACCHSLGSATVAAATNDLRTLLLNLDTQPQNPFQLSILGSHFQSVVIGI